MIRTIGLSAWMLSWAVSAHWFLNRQGFQKSRPPLARLAILGLFAGGTAVALLAHFQGSFPRLFIGTGLLSVSALALGRIGATVVGALGEKTSTVRQRLIRLSVICGLVGAIPAWTPIWASLWAGPAGIATSVTLRIILVWCFAGAFASRYTIGLRAATAALAEIEHGNLDVHVDPDGDDEISEIARALNVMTAQLRRVEFLVQLNDELRAQAEELQRTLDALKQAQTDLVRAERMASVATLVRGIAHELNNPIGYIAGNMPILRRYCDFIARVAETLGNNTKLPVVELEKLTRFSASKDLDFVCTDLERMSADLAEGARRAQLIIGDLQTLTSAARRHFEDVDVRRAIEQSISLISPRLPPGATVEIDLEEVPALRVRAGQLEQVLVNLLDNARRAVGPEGRLRLSLRRVAGSVVLSVEDNGRGMSAEVLKRAVDPFFTTRAVGEGSGLGLAIAASIVRAHQGTLELKSQEGAGTRVEVRLPLPGHAHA
jgi:two-component system NtrC family sensor kinase